MQDAESGRNADSQTEIQSYNFIIKEYLPTNTKNVLLSNTCKYIEE